MFYVTIEISEREKQGDLFYGCSVRWLQYWRTFLQIIQTKRHIKLRFKKIIASHHSFHFV